MPVGPHLRCAAEEPFLKQDSKPSSHLTFNSPHLPDDYRDEMARADVGVR